MKNTQLAVACTLTFVLLVMAASVHATPTDFVQANDGQSELIRHSKTVHSKRFNIGFADQVAKFGPAVTSGRKFVCSYTGWYRIDVDAVIANRDTVLVPWTIGVWAQIGNSAVQNSAIRTSARAERVRIVKVVKCIKGERMSAGITVKDMFKYRIRYSKIQIKLVSLSN